MQTPAKMPNGLVAQIPCLGEIAETGMDCQDSQLNRDIGRPSVAAFKSVWAGG